MDERDVAVVGGGILGTSVAFWLAARFDGRIAVIEREPEVAAHTSARNTGLVHRPFYLHPEQARTFARAAQVSYGLWKSYAAQRDLPWRPAGTYKVATDDAQIPTLRKNERWATENGMSASEVEFLDGREVAKREPHLTCAGALFVKTDTCVDFSAFTRALRADAQAMGAKFLTSAPVASVSEDPGGGLLVRFDAGRPELRARFLVNCAGGGSLDLAHKMGVGLEYADLHFRGEYWTVDEMANFVNHNVYSVPRHADLPFLDPHWIVRANGRREIGPNAVPVSGPMRYEPGFGPPREWVEKFFEPPIANKLALWFNRTFLSLSAREVLSSLSKSEMMRRVQQFIPALRSKHLVSRGFAGIRSNVVNRKGSILKEALELHGPHSYHIVNYNSPGATGAPGYAAYLVDRLAARGDLDILTPNPKKAPLDWDAVAKAMGFIAA